MSNEGHNILFETVLEVIRSEGAETVLEISGYDMQCGGLLKDAAVTVDRVDLTDTLTEDAAVAAESGYNNIFGSDILTDFNNLEKYDIIIIFHLFENMEREAARHLLEALLTKVSKQVLVFTPEYPYDLDSEIENKKSDVRAYHPVFFLGIDYAYRMFDTPEGAMQVYSFFPKFDYQPLPCDKLPETGYTGAGRKKRKLKIAYIIDHHSLSGGMKAVYAHMRMFAENGHRVTAYYRSDTAKRALPAWSELLDEDAIGEVVVPKNVPYIDYFRDEDIVVLSFLKAATEFAHADIPAVLWEQGSPYLYGNYGSLYSKDIERMIVHYNYRLPVHLLAVSQIVQTIFKEVYNRESQYFPTGIDTDFYYPLENKNAVIGASEPQSPTDIGEIPCQARNDPESSSGQAPIILMIGNPTWTFKGIGAALKALVQLYNTGSRFAVQLVSQGNFTINTELVYPFEKIINPPQSRLAEICRNADILLSNSLYESQPLPPLEAMASGTAVVAADCGGINQYAEPGVNCLLYEQGDTKSMLFALEYLLQDSDARERLAKAGRETALRYSYKEIMPQLEDCLYKIIERNI